MLIKFINQQKIIKELKEEMKVKDENIDGLKDVINTQIRNSDSRDVAIKHETSMQKAKYDSEIEIINNRFDKNVSEGRNEIEQENIELKKANAVNKKEIEILETAFRNMGGDIEEINNTVRQILGSVNKPNEVHIIKE